MPAILEVVASERAKRYRALAEEARVLAARSKRAPRYEGAYLRMAQRWEELALEADAEAEAGEGPEHSSVMADSSEQRGAPGGPILV